MKIQMESTQEITEDFGIPCRLWKGHTESGIPVYCFVHRVVVPAEKDLAAFEQELLEMPAPKDPVSLRRLLP